MPIFPKGFARRKSSGNVLDFENAPPAEPSFRILERPGNAGKSFDGGAKLKPGRSSISPKHHDDNIFADIKGSRGSAASHTNSASTADNSSRLSATSTAPSSTDLPRHDDFRSPHEKCTDIPPPPIPKSSSMFSLKASARSFSFGRKHSTPSPGPSQALEDYSPVEGHTPDEPPSRPRAVTSSSYASTATPPKLDEREISLNLGGDFVSMFANIGKRTSPSPMGSGNDRVLSQSPEFAPSSSATARPFQVYRKPSPLKIDRAREVEASPFSWDSQTSQDRLIANSSPLNAPPPVPSHDSPVDQARPQRPGSSSNGLKRSSALSVRRQSTLEFSDAVDEDAELLRASLGALKNLPDDSNSMQKARQSWLNPLTGTDANGESSGAGVSRSHGHNARDENMFDDQIAAAINLATQFDNNPNAPVINTGPKNKVMTPAQFERYRQEKDRLRSLGAKSPEDDNEEDNYDDEMDEAERQRELTRQRRKQEAHMAVYRQQMMKITGESPSPGPTRPGMITSQSTPNLQIHVSDLVESPEEEDEEVPLAILAAHGFPNKNRPPTQLSSMNSNPNLRAASQMGAYPPPQSVAGGSNAGGRASTLPAFARNLPQDPYFGASLVNPTNRESLAMGTGSSTGAGRGLPPGGLVGVIAQEERSRAMRRGSPNAVGEYPGAPTNGFEHPGLPRSVTMGSMPPMPMGPVPMGPMAMPMPPMFPGDPAVAQQMQEFMQMQMQFMQLMTSGQLRPQSAGGQPPQLPPFDSSSRPGSAHQRAMTMLDPNAAPWMQQRNSFAPSSRGNGYAPSITPSERSNVGQPGRYRPVSQHPAMDKSRASTMSGALQGWSENKSGSVTVKAVKKSNNNSDEDEEEAWEAMKQKREKKKSMWKSKKDLNGIKEMLNFVD